jgi:predicted MFS family arabinose efflux permease
MGLLLVLTGLAIAALATTEYALVDRLAPPGTATEAYSWQIVANVIGAAAGSFIGGVLAEDASVQWALATASIACAAGFGIAFAGRRSLRPAALAES